MTDAFTTHTTTRLLDSLKESIAGDTWIAFDARYRPILMGIGRAAGLTEAEAEDAAQQALAEFARDLRAERYQRGKGRLRSWLMGIARHRIIDVLRARKGHRGDSALSDAPDDATMTSTWETEQRRLILEEALVRLKKETRTADRTIKAFELAAIRGMPAEAVAAECGMTVDDVYVAKNRVTARLRAIVEQITSEYSEDA